MTIPAWITSDGETGVARPGSRLEIHAVPGAARDGLAGLHGDRLKIRVCEPPEGGRANEAIRRVLANALGLPFREVELVRGGSSRAKTFRVPLDPAAVAARLGPVV